MVLVKASSDARIVKCVPVQKTVTCVPVQQTACSANCLFSKLSMENEQTVYGKKKKTQIIVWVKF